jgi:hypothetical protein
MDDNNMMNMMEAPDIVEGAYTIALPMPPVTGPIVSLKAQSVNAILKAGNNTMALGYQEQRNIGPYHSDRKFRRSNFQARFPERTDRTI